MNLQKKMERAKALKVDKRESWIMERRPFNVPIGEEGEEEVYPDILMCVSSSKDLIIGTNIIMPDSPDSKILEWALGCMLKPMIGEPLKPADIKLTGGKLKHLQKPLEDLGVSVTAQSLPNPALDEIVAAMERDLTAPGVIPYTSRKGVKPDTVADFFRAASGFYQAKPWELFEYEIPIRVELQSKKKTRYWAIVMGTGGEEFGLSLYRSSENLLDIMESEDEDEALGAALKTWSLAFSFIDFNDIGPEAQIECITHEWPLVEGNLYPSALVVNPAKEELADRPTNKELIDLTAVTRALTGFLTDNSDEIEDEETLQETRKVNTVDGDILVSIDFPAPEFYEEEVEVEEDKYGEDEEEELLFDPFANYPEPPKKASTPLDRAQALVNEANDEESKNKRIKLARQAIAISPDCADAYLLLSEDTARDDNEALKYIKEAVEAGRRAIGDEFDELTGHFWSAWETRPYMRARARLAFFHEMRKEYDQAIEHYREMLRLNPNDNQGVRYSLSRCLMLTGQDDKVRKLLKEFDEDTNTIWLYNKALMNFKQSGGSKKTNISLAKAVARNSHVLDYLMERKRIPADISFSYIVGGEDEAILYAFLFLEIWKSTEGAVEWLKSMFDKKK